MDIVSMAEMLNNNWNWKHTIPISKEAYDSLCQKAEVTTRYQEYYNQLKHKMDKVKTEIAEEMKEYDYKLNDFYDGVLYGLKLALNIINKYFE